MAPAIKNGVIYFGGNDGYFYAVEAKDGKLVWKVSVGSEITTSAAVGENLVFFGCMDGKLYAMDIHTGSEKWSKNTGVSNRSSPAIVGSILYLGGAVAFLALDSRTGDLLWVFDTKGGATYASPFIHDGVFYCAGGDWVIYAIE
jgi:outer membrane protein assembly factor BamB